MEAANFTPLPLSQLFILTDPDPRGHRNLGEAAAAGKEVEWKKATSLARSADQMV
jgi:hypothetical protein